MNLLLVIIILLSVAVAVSIVILARMMLKARKQAQLDFNLTTYNVACAGSGKYVTAPTTVATSDVNSTFLDSKGLRIPVEQFHRMIVRGNSMSLCNISDGDLIFVKKDFNPDSLKDNMPKILVIKRRAATPEQAQYKVRRTWLAMSASDLSSPGIFASITSLPGFAELINGSNSPGLQAMIDDFTQARIPNYLRDYPNAHLAEDTFNKVVISTTLDTDTGKIHFSIHPQANILGIVCHIFSLS